MKTVVYVDVLLAMNLFITYLLLLCSSKLLGVYASVGRLLPGTILGAAYSLVLLAPSIGTLLTLLLKLCMCISIVCLTFRPRSLRRIVRYSLCFFAVSAAFAGSMLLIDSIFSPGFMTYNNGTVYFGIGFFSLLFCAVLSYFLVLGIGRLWNQRMKNTVCTIQIYCDGLFAEGVALVDTGNSLYDVTGSRPAAVASFSFIKPLLPEELHPFFRGDFSQDALKNTAWKNRITILPVSTAAAKTLLPGFRPDRVLLTKAGRKQRLTDCTIAVVTETLAGGDYQILLNPDMLRETNGKEETANEDASKVPIGHS